MNRKPIPLSEFALLSDLEPTWEERLARLEKAAGPHPLFKPINIESDSEDEEPAHLVKKGKEREDGALAGKKRVRDGLGPAEDARKDAEKAIEALEPPKKRIATASTRQPASKPVPAQSAKRPLPTPAEVLVLEELSDGPVASTSKLPAASQTKNRSPPTTSPSAASAPVVEGLSSDSDLDGHAPGPTTHVSKVRGIGKAITPRSTRPSAVDVSIVAGKAGGVTARTRKKPRLSLEQALAEARKLKGDKLVEQFKTVSDFIDYLEQFSPQLAESKKVLAGCRIVFLNTDHWRHSRQIVVRASASAVARNRFDQALRTNMSVAAKNGAILVRPEDFVPPPYEVTGEPFDLERAEAEGWTTHIIPLVPQGQRMPSYKEIIACLGPDASGITRDELGPFVQVVGFSWITKCIDVKGKASEWPYVLKGDFRQSELEAEKEQKVRQVLKERERARKKQAKLEAAKQKKLGGKGKGQEQEDTDVEESDASDGHMDGVSPLGPEDWPEGEAPPAGYFDQATSQSTLSSLPPRQKTAKKPTSRVGGGGSLEQGVGMSAPIEDVDLTRETAGPSSSPAAQASPTGKGKAKTNGIVVPQGLEEELAMVNKYSLEEIDEFIEKGSIDPAPVSFDDDECMILSNRFDSFSTEEENSDEEKEEFKPRKRIRRKYQYACDNPEENRATRSGPNEAVAFQLEKLADLQSTITDKDQFRQRSYKQAADKLRGCPAKVSRYDQLIKLRGIGAKMANKIIEIHRTGELDSATPPSISN
ncbi:DNA polymerase lambda [Rhodotorula toruloides]|uniref:DNA polymerase lambda n=1 Tax=Rhodotorula toruloides TaxID=5286 RepID=A0A511KRY0_RHOTO|nr:DNA polymerase lambda [Rhodotorula toruloides]